MISALHKPVRVTPNRPSRSIPVPNYTKPTSVGAYIIARSWSAVVCFVTVPSQPAHAGQDSCLVSSRHHRNRCSFVDHVPVLHVLCSSAREPSDFGNLIAIFWCSGHQMFGHRVDRCFLLGADESSLSLSQVSPNLSPASSEPLPSLSHTSFPASPQHLEPLLV